jgi:AraC-like DNA-binding protein
MYSYLFFALMITCIFLIIENLKNFQSGSLLKYHFVGLLVCQLLANYLSFSKEIGTSYAQIFTINKILTSILIVNALLLIVDYAISKILLVVEFLFIMLYAVFIIKGFYFADMRIGNSFQIEDMKYQAILSFIQSTIFIFFIAFALIRIINKTKGQNLYYRKLRIWAIIILIFLIFCFVPFIYALYMFFNPGKANNTLLDTRLVLVIARTIILLFILLRPRFINESGLSYSPYNYISKIANEISNEKFDFLFFKNHYYLNTEANLEDFSLKLNFPKGLVSDFINENSKCSFSDLLNQHRILYFKELLKLGKHNEFTIEALSEMSGFNNRRTMYYAFKKYTDLTPTEYISSLK